MALSLANRKATVLACSAVNDALWRVFAQPTRRSAEIIMNGVFIKRSSGRTTGIQPRGSLDVNRESGRQLSNSKFNRLVQSAALRTARTVHICVIGVNITAIFAAEDPVLGVRRPETSPADLGKNPKPKQRAERQRHININHCLNAHGVVAGALVAGNGIVCQLKMISPTVKFFAGENRAARANSRARRSASTNPLDASNTTDTMFPFASTNA